MERLQSQLRRFKTELADVGGIGADVRVNVDGFLRFADYFFDGIFVDFAVMDHISNSAEQVQAVTLVSQMFLERLHAMLSRTETELNEQGAGGRACAQSVNMPGSCQSSRAFSIRNTFCRAQPLDSGLFNGDLSWVLHVAAAWAAVVLGAALRNPDQGLTWLGLRRRLRRERRFRRCGRLRRGLCGWFRRRGRLRRRRRGDLGRGRGLRVCVFSIELPMAPITTKATTSQNHHLL